MKQTYISLLFISVFCAVASAACFYFASGYTELSVASTQQQLVDKIHSTSDVNLLKDMALHIHESYVISLQDHSALYESLVKIFAAIAVLAAITFGALYKHNASNQSLNSDAQKARAR